MNERRLRKDIGLTKFRGKVATDLQMLRRLECADDDGFCTCISCGKRGHYKDMQGGHFIPRGKIATLLNESNIWPQCKTCNKPSASGGKNGNVSEYRKGLVKIIGEEGVLALESMQYQESGLTRLDLADMRENYRLRIKREKERLGE